MRAFGLFLLLVLANAAPAQVRPIALREGDDAGEVQRHVRQVHYDVSGQTASDLVAALHTHGPSLHGRRFFGQTEWEVSARYFWVERAGTCSVKDLTVEVAVSVLLPRWQGYASAPAELREAWDGFVAALEHHEDGHRRLAEAAGEAVRHRLASLQAPTCAGMEQRAHREVAEVLEEFTERNEAYDAHTGHGASQGATWPPRPRVYLSSVP